MHAETKPDANQQLYRSATTTALNGVYHLGLLGCCIRRIEIDSATPVIEIDPPSPRGGLRGALHRRVTVNGVTRTTMVTRTHGCTVQWETTSASAPAPAASAAPLPDDDELPPVIGMRIVDSLQQRFEKHLGRDR